MSCQRLLPCSCISLRTFIEVPWAGSLFTFRSLLNRVAALTNPHALLLEMPSFSRTVLAAWLVLALHLSFPVAAAPFNRSSSLIQKRSISISVLKASSAVTNGCTPPQIAAINTAINEGKQLAAGASLALANPKIKTSTNFKNWMGASNNPLTIDAEHFVPIATNLNQASSQVDNLDNLGQNDLTYVCPPEADCGSGSPGEVTARYVFRHPYYVQSPHGPLFCSAHGISTQLRMLPM